MDALRNISAVTPMSANTFIGYAYKVRGFPADRYVDGLPNYYDGGDNTSLRNTERIEVLKGPQGTLYGGANIGGAIKYVTKDPTQSWENEATLELGQYRTWNLDAVISGPITDQLAQLEQVDPQFQAAYNAWQHDAIATGRGKLLALTDAALEAVRRALDNGDAKIGLVVLKSTGILDRPEPGSTDPEEVQARQAIARERGETNLFMDKLAAGFPK